MSEAVASTVLTDGQLNLIARRYGALSGKSFVDVGCGDGAWILRHRKKGRSLVGLEEKRNFNGTPDEGILLGSPSANVPWEAHSQETILFRGTGVWNSPAYSPELMIALANLGSCLKKKGKLLIPISHMNESEIADWTSQLEQFPGTVRTRTLKTGLKGILTLAFLFGWTYRVEVLEFRVNKQLSSRLEWHRLAREAVMKACQPNAAA